MLNEDGDDDGDDGNNNYCNDGEGNENRIKNKNLRFKLFSTRYHTNICLLTLVHFTNNLNEEKAQSKYFWPSKIAVKFLFVPRTKERVICMINSKVDCQLHLGCI